MKNRIIRVFAAALAVAMLVLLLASCGKGISTDTAKKTVKDFLTCVENDDYDGALALMHPKHGTVAEAIRVAIEREEADEGIDLSLGITDIKYHGFSSSLYDTEVGGSKYELSGSARAGGVAFEFEIEMVKNDGGYGITEFDLDR